MIIAIDFDGTVVEHMYPEIGQDVPLAVETIKELAEQGHFFILYTMRSGYYLGEAIYWFAKNGLPLWGIQYNPDQAKWSQSNKCYAELYIDDAAFGCPLIKPEGFIKEVVDWSKVRESFGIIC